MDDSTEEASTEVVSPKPKVPPPPILPEKEDPIKEEEEEIPTLCPNTGMLLTAALTQGRSCS